MTKSIEKYEILRRGLKKCRMFLILFSFIIVFFPPDDIENVPARFGPSTSSSSSRVLKDSTNMRIHQLCDNCENLIPFDDYENHRQICETFIVEEYEEFESMDFCNNGE